MAYGKCGAGNSPAPNKVIPERIKEAREGRGFSIDAFAEAIGVTKQAVAQYETGQISPSGEMLSAIIRETQQPPSFFYSSRAGAADIRPFWRSLKRMELVHRKRIKRRMGWAADIRGYLDRYLDLPDANFPPVDFDHNSDDPSSIEDIADMLRDHWGLGRGPIVDLVGHLEINGIILVEEDVNCSDMDAVSSWVEGRPYIMMSNSVLGPRKNYNMAHELAHLILHADVELDSSNLAKIESQADRFAGAFLMPQDTFGQEILGTSLAYFVQLKRRWNVSIAAMAYRAKELGVISQSQIGYLYRQMNARKIRLVEPLDHEIVVQKPSILSHSVKMLMDHGVQTKQQIADHLSVNVSDIESLCGLEPGALETKVIDLRARIAIRSD